jgi:hypothetical protein
MILKMNPEMILRERQLRVRTMTAALSYPADKLVGEEDF